MQPRDNKWGIPWEMVAQAAFIITPLIAIAVALFIPGISNNLKKLHVGKHETNNVASTNDIQRKIENK